MSAEVLNKLFGSSKCKRINATADAWSLARPPVPPTSTKPWPIAAESRLNLHQLFQAM
jgi:hypothetical protein